MHGRAVILSMLSLVSLGGCTQPNPLYYATATGSEPESDGPSSSEGGLAGSESTDATWPSAGGSGSGGGSASASATDDPWAPTTGGDETTGGLSGTTGEASTTSGSTGSAPGCEGSGAVLCHEPLYVLVSTAASTLDVGDYDDDGDVDIVLASEGADEVVLLASAGNGLFSQTATAQIEGARPTGICFADLDGRPPLEVVTADRDGHALTVLRADGGVLVVAQVVDTHARTEDCAVVDVDGDGALDVVAALRDADAIAVAYNEGGGMLGTPIEFGVVDQPETLAAAPGLPPVLGASHRGGRATSVLHGDGDGGLSATTIASDLEHYGSALADLDADGTLDLVSCRPTVGEVVIYWDALAEGGPAATTTESVGDDPAHVAIGDFNGDGHPDVAVGVEGSNRLALLSGVGGRTFAVSAIALEGAPHDVATADLNDDGLDDIALTLPGEGEIVLFLSNPD